MESINLKSSNTVLQYCPDPDLYATSGALAVVVLVSWVTYSLDGHGDMRQTPPVILTVVLFEDKQFMLSLTQQGLELGR